MGGNIINIRAVRINFRRKYSYAEPIHSASDVLVRLEVQLEQPSTEIQTIVGK